MSRIVESPAHRQVRGALRDMTLKIKSLGVNEFDLQQLKELCIDINPITLDETSGHKPSYFPIVYELITTSFFGRWLDK